MASVRGRLAGRYWGEDELQRHRTKLLRKYRSCNYCHARLTERTATVDHLIPESRGGTDDPGNLALACLGCNKSKGSRLPLDYIVGRMGAGRHLTHGSGQGAGR
jgi:5-methylcytosine-specific restriction endonuclease McrA